MPRLPFTHTRDSIYHVVLRSNRRQVLFDTAEDRRALNEATTETLQRFDATLHGYCLMPNQFRALLQIEDRKLVKALKGIVSRYARHREESLASNVALFERPFDARRVETTDEFLRLLRRIHLSPFLANEVVDLDDYLWSSHRAYLGFDTVAQITTEFGLALFATDVVQARGEYGKFIAAGLATATTDDESGESGQFAVGDLPMIATTGELLRDRLNVRKTKSRRGGREPKHPTRRYLSIY